MLKTKELLALLSGKGAPTLKGWDCQYENGNWGYMHQLQELARYSVIAGYFQHLKPGGSILDIGCGEGILQQRLAGQFYSHYFGIDISGVAIEKATIRGNENTFFIEADAEHYLPSESFDAIIFNEILYYISNPISLLKRYESFLKSDGVYIISMFHDLRNAMIWRRLPNLYFLIDEVKVSNKSGVSWVCRVVKPT
jgi:2-polyprenyl-3-methyl-5-hydroxy-6-metoxy-1,4-benzoquinol methylase